MSLAPMAGADARRGTAVRIGVFGGLRVWHDDVEANIGPPMQRAMLALLLVLRGRTVSMNRIVDTLWGDVPPASAHNQIQRYAGRLRRLLEPDVAKGSANTCLAAARGGYRLDPEELDCDLVRFAEAFQLARQTISPEDALSAASTALTYASREPFQDIEPAIRERDEFRAVDRQVVAAAAIAADAALTLGRAGSVIDEVRAVAATVPLDEPLHSRVVRLLAAQGRGPEALVVFDSIRRRLREELGVDPGAELRHAHSEVLHADDPAGVARVSREGTGTAVPALTPSELPADVAGYVDSPGVGGVCDALRLGEVRVVAISGMPGVGKTALAVHWAHQLAPEFPDGQLYLNLRGFDATEPPVQAGDAAGVLLRTLGIEPDPDQTLEARSARFRSAVAGKRVLILLDNARDTDQVRPLLPGSPGSAVVVTSRNRLVSLVVREGARAVLLEPLPPAEAAQLLAVRLGAARLDARPDARDRLIEACSGLPLALSIVSAQAVLNPQLTIEDIAADIVAILPTVTTSDASQPPSADVDLGSIFDWSHSQLSESAADLFARLSVCPSHHIPLNLAASLNGRSESECRAIARQLTTASLLEEPAKDTYALHDLLRLYAAAQIPPSKRDDAVERLDHFYAHSVRNAHLAYGAPARDEIEPCPPGVHPETFDSLAAAYEWYLRERSSLDAVTASLADRGHYRGAARLANDRRMYAGDLDTFEQRSEIFQAGLRHAEASGSTRLIAEAHRALGNTLRAAGQHGPAMTHLKAAESLCAQIGDTAGRLLVLHAMATVAEVSGDFGQSLEFCELVLEGAPEAGMSWLAASAVIIAANTRLRMGDPSSALEWCNRAEILGVADGDKSRLRLARIECHTELGNYEEAIRLAEEPGGFLPEEATKDLMASVAYTYFKAGQLDAAVAACRQFLSLLANVEITTPDLLDTKDQQRVLEVLTATGNLGLADGILDIPR